LIPGGFGAAKNLCDFGFKGPDMTVQPDIEAILKDFHSNNKVIGLTCIAPIVAAKVLGSKGVKMTLGDTTDNFPYAGSIEVASSFGANM
jgi:enhancing lycopene biosynthesis protein 2